MLWLAALVGSLIFDTAVSWIRMLAALFISIVLGLFIGILANRSEAWERVLLPILDIFQTLPILAFFPFVIYIVVAGVPGALGINLAVIFLIITSMVWNIAFGSYEAVRSIPREFEEVEGIFQMGPIERLTKVTIPAAMPKVIEQASLSWAIGLFYLVTSEIFSVGLQIDSVKYGIGAKLASLAFQQNFDIATYVMGITIFIIFVVATRLLLFRYLEKRFITKEYRPKHKGPIMRAVENSTVGLRVLDTLSKRMKKTFGMSFRRLGQEERREIKRMEKIGRKTERYLVIALVAIVIIALAISPNLRGEEWMVLYSLATSIARIWIAFAVILLVAVPLGVYMVFMTKKSNAYMLFFQVLASIPATILLPLIAVSLKNVQYGGELVAFFIFFLSGFWYVLFGVISTRATVPSEVNEVQEIFGVKGKSAWKFIYLKAILPGLVTGCITGIAAEWNASIVAEQFTTSVLGNGTVITSVGVGVGKLLDVALGAGNLGLMALGLINLTVMIIIINRLLWKRLYGKTIGVYR